MECKRTRIKFLATLLCLALAVSILMIPASKTKAAEAGNLLINGDAEAGNMNGWVDPDDIWSADPVKLVFDGTNFEGKYFFFPRRGYPEATHIYQDVKVTKDMIGKQVVLSALIGNYNQPPHDQASLHLILLNSKGKVIKEYVAKQRNASWIKHTLSAVVNKDVATIRVKLAGKRYEGSYLDSYFDSISLTIPEEIQNFVYISAKKEKAKIGDKLTLTANNGTSTKASDYEWSSSYNTNATVNNKGVVEILAEEEVVIYAKDKKTGITGSYFINSEENENITPAPDKVTGLKKSKVTNTAITLKWTKAENCSGYYVYQYNASTKKYEKVKTIKKASTVKATISKLKKGTEYKFKVVAFREFGGETYSSPGSKVVTISTKK